MKTRKTAMLAYKYLKGKTVINKYTAMCDLELEYKTFFRYLKDFCLVENKKYSIYGAIIKIKNA